MQKKYISNGGFTLAELMISVFISAVVLGGIMFFMSDTIGSVSDAKKEARFIRGFHSFISVFENGDMQLLEDNGEGIPDIGILEIPGKTGAILVGVVDRSTMQLLPKLSAENYHETLLAYRLLSETEYTALQSNTNLAYSYNFTRDKIFTDFYVKDMQLEAFNSGDIMNMDLEIFPYFRDSFQGDTWVSLPRTKVFRYSLAL